MNDGIKVIKVSINSYGNKYDVYLNKSKSDLLISLGLSLEELIKEGFISACLASNFGSENDSQMDNS